MTKKTKIQEPLVGVEVEVGYVVTQFPFATDFSYEDGILLIFRTNQIIGIYKDFDNVKFVKEAFQND